MITSLLKAKIACKQHQDCTSQGAAFTAVEQPRLTPKGLTPKGSGASGPCATSVGMACHAVALV